MRGGGLGLGLFIAERIVAGHHGQITVRSNAQEGTIFAVTLPCVSTTFAVTGERSTRGDAEPRDWIKRVAPRRRRGVRLLFFQVAAISRFARERLFARQQG